MIFEALNEGRRLERERLHAYEIPVAQLTAIYANSQKTKPPYYKYSDFYLFADDEGSINFQVCATFMSVVNDGILPSWILRLAPYEELQKGEDRAKASSPRLWMCRGLAIFCPKVEDEYLMAGMAVFDDDYPSGEVTVFDVDTKETIIIDVPVGIEEAYILDVCWSRNNA